MIRRLIGSVLSLTVCGAMVGGSDMVGSFGSGGGGGFTSSGPKRIVLDPDSGSFRTIGGHRFVSAPIPGADTSSEADSGGLFANGGLAGQDGAHLPDTMREQIAQIEPADTGKLRGHAMGGSLSSFVSRVNHEMDQLLSKVDPSGGGASVIACLLPGREHICK